MNKPIDIQTSMPETNPTGERCATKWPLFLVHGIGFKYAERLKYWGRIPEALRQQGANVYISHQDSWGSIESNALQLREELFRILKEAQTDKVNIIAHSKGGLDSRLLAALPDCTDHIASITTMATPHHGARTINWVANAPTLLKLLVSLPIDIALILLGDDNPSFVRVCQELNTEEMTEFNQRYPVPENIYLQSYAVVQKRPTGDLLFLASMPLIRAVDGPNDGLVTPDSAALGEFKGLMHPDSDTGLSHSDCVDSAFPLRPWSRAEGNDFDVPGWWVDVVEDLKHQGF